MPSPSPKQILVELRYDGDLPSDVKKMLGAGMSWREMAERVSARCGHDVSYETLRTWYGKVNAA